MSSCSNPAKPLTSAEHRVQLQTIEFFQHLPKDTLSQLEQAGQTTNYHKGQLIFMQDDPAEWFYMVETGWVKLFRETLDGHEVILDVLPAGTLFGETSIFENENYPYAAEIVEAGKITAYPLHILEKQINNNSMLALEMLKHLSRKNTLKDREVEHRTVMNAPQRIGCFLLRLCKVNQKGAITLHLPYDKTLIASRLGMQPETFSRALSRLQEDTQIKIKGPTVEISNLGDLISYTCRACSNAYPCEDKA